MNRPSNPLLAHFAVFLEWRFDNAWNLGLGRHYLG
ncbi:rpoE leader peptide RseD [Lelliottia sp. CFBP8978]|nr:rpoE leader peptide RseD [Lelliottia sp. CFBP8978]MDY1035885.1 rpoE leader peptide RseD [Lelliottia sp. CFBP8978]